MEKERATIQNPYTQKRMTARELLEDLFEQKGMDAFSPRHMTPGKFECHALMFSLLTAEDLMGALNSLEDRLDQARRSAENRSKAELDKQGKFVTDMIKSLAELRKSIDKASKRATRTGWMMLALTGALVAVAGVQAWAMLRGG